jgi:hypothetical protein
MQHNVVVKLPFRTHQQPLITLHFHFQIVEDFEEASVQSRGFGILDVGYRSKVTITEMNCTWCMCVCAYMTSKIEWVVPF